MYKTFYSDPGYIVSTKLYLILLNYLFIQIHLYKLCKDECNIYIKQVYHAQNKKHLEDFLPILAIVRQELLIVLPHK